MRNAKITNTADIIYSRDIVERIDELREILEAEYEDAGECDSEFEEWLLSAEGDEAEELRALEKLAEQCKYYGDWGHGERLIHNDYFTEYARRFAEDIGAVNPDAPWPHRFIDWEAAAEELKRDYYYMAVDFDGETYWIRD